VPRQTKCDVDMPYIGRVFRVTQMTIYRVYTIDGSGRTAGFYDGNWSDDEVAVAFVASSIKPGEKVEVWSGDRRLGRYINSGTQIKVLHPLFTSETGDDDRTQPKGEVVPRIRTGR
jgi:hypothetical protein